MIKITETKLRKIIRSIIKEQKLLPQLSTPKSDQRAFSRIAKHFEKMILKKPKEGVYEIYFDDGSTATINIVRHLVFSRDNLRRSGYQLLQLWENSHISPEVLVHAFKKLE